MNKTQAATLLGVSVRAVERYAAADKLAARYVRGKTGQVLDFDEAEVERFKATLDAPVAKRPPAPSDPTLDPSAVSDALRQRARDGSGHGTPVEARQSATGTPGELAAELARVDAPSADAPEGALESDRTLQLLVRALREAPASGARSGSVPIEAKPLLTLGECSALTGLSRATLKRAVDEGGLRAQQIARTWRVRRDQLDEWLKTL